MMKITRLYTLFILFICSLTITPLIAKVSALPLEGEQGGGLQVDTIWPARHYRELDGRSSGDQMAKAWIDWHYPEGTVLVYGLHFPKGHVRADALFEAKSGKMVTFGVRIVHPATGTVVLEHSATSTKTSTAEQRMEIMPETDMPYDGWYRFELTCPNGGNTLSRLNIMEFQRESSLKVTDSEIFMAPSVHLWWDTTMPGAPSGQGYDWTYLEVMYPEEYKQWATYQMAIGTDVGYSGIQMPTRSDGSFGNTVLFSVWDNGDVEKDRNLPEFMRAAAVDIGPGAYATRFGGEGTGSSIRFNADTLWKFNHWIQFLLNERPEHTTVTVPDGSPEGNTTDYTSTLQSMWFKMADEPDWHYIGTLRVAGADRLTSGIYSFLENFGNGGGNLMRRCYFRNGAMRSAASGKWFALNKAGFGNTQNNGKRESRYDFGHGVTQLFENAMYLETGGYMGKRDSANTYPAPVQGQMPWVDTIDISRLNARIDLALTRNRANSVLSSVEQTRVVSDPATWQLTAFSDQETEGEGDNGRAAFIMDGDLSTYYHNKWKNGSVGFPHTFTFDAGTPVTVSSIELYQSRDNGYRAKQLQLQTSEDGKKWSNASSRLDVEDTDYPTIQLDSAITSRYFRVRFITGYGSNLVINELYFKHEYRLDDLLALARRILSEADHFGGYAPADLEALSATYDEGRGTDLDALRTAIEDVGRNALPLTYGVVSKAEHLSSFCTYQIHSLNGSGDLVCTEDGQLTFVDNATVTPLVNNWLILYSADFMEYYIYNLGTQQFLGFSDAKWMLSDTPVPIDITRSGKGFRIGDTLFELRNNYALTPDNNDVLYFIKQTEQQTHPEAVYEPLCQQAVETYGKAFVTTINTKERLILGSGYLTSNVNSTQQEAHNLAKLIDRNTNTYWESWYSGIEWPNEPGYVQTRLRKDVQAFYLTFTPSQSAEYGRSDIPADIRIYISPDSKDFSFVQEITEGLPTEIKQTYTSPVIFCGQDIRYVRMEVLSTLENRAGGRVFAMSEMQIHPATVDEEASLYCQRPAVKEAVDNLSTELAIMRAAINAKTVTPEDAERLQAAIDRAEASYLDPTGIEDIKQLEYSGEHSNRKGVTCYDLSGRPVLRPENARRGIYIFTSTPALRCLSGK